MAKIAIMGCGVVGSGVADILMEQSNKLSARFDKEVVLSKILDIRDMAGTPYAPYMTPDADSIINDNEIDIVVVTIGGLDFAYNMAKKSLLAGKHVVTSNKEVVAAYGKELTEIAFEKKVRFLYEASAGGGIPVIRPLNICLASNDIYEIHGILNGTTNYILTKMKNDGMSFDAALKRAQEKGYAEANPSADVDGHDAARKIAILSSIAYNEFVDYNNVSCTGIRNVSIEDIDFAQDNDLVIKLIAHSFIKDGKVFASVEPMALPKTNMLASVESVFNAVLTKGSYTGDTLFYGKGAGKLATASAVMGDVIEILCGSDKEATLPGFTKKDAVMGDLSSEKSRYMIRFTFNDDQGTALQGAAMKIFNAETVTVNYEKKYLVIATGYMTESELSAAASSCEDTFAVKFCNSIKIAE